MPAAERLQILVRVRTLEGYRRAFEQRSGSGHHRLARFAPLAIAPAVAAGGGRFFSAVTMEPYSALEAVAASITIIDMAKLMTTHFSRNMSGAVG